MLAFGLAALAASVLGSARDQRVAIAGVVLPGAVAVGLLAALASILPDLDVVQTVLVAAVDASGDGPIDRLRAASRATHRLVTHSVVLAVPIAAAIGWWARRRWLASAFLVGVVALVAATSGAIAGIVAGVIALAAAGLGVLAGRWGLPARVTAGAAVLGYGLHPLTDLLTGTPPAMFAPLEVTLVAERIAPFGDPLANLLLATGVELLVIWVGIAVAARLLERSLRSARSPVALVGLVGVPAVIALEAPGVENAVAFVAILLVVGAIAAGGQFARDRTPGGAIDAAVTGIAAITVTVLATAPFAVI